MEKESSGLVLFMDIIILVTFLALASMAMDLQGASQVQHLTIVIILMLFAFFGLVAAYNKSVAGWNGLVFIFALAMLEMFWIYFNHKTRFTFLVIVSIVSLIGFFVSVVKAASDDYGDDDEFEAFEPRQPAKVAEDKPKEPEKPEPAENISVEEINPNHSVVYKSIQPGKYVASKTGNTYHVPYCDWAKKIRKTNLLWFSEEKEAKKQGYKKHDCVTY